MTAAKLETPASPEALEPEWLTLALRETGTITDAAVTSLDTEMIAEGVGLMGQLARVTLRYDRLEADAPPTLIAKFPTTDKETRAFGNAFHVFEREVRFYDEIASEIELRTPQCYYRSMDVAADEYVLLLEDLAPARAGDQLAGCSTEEAELAIRELAKFHAGWWESPRLDEIDWMPYGNASFITKSVEESYQGAWDPFLERFGDRMPESLLETAQRLGSKAGEIIDQLVEPPRTIYHGDYRADNLFFASPQGGAPLAVIDWAISARGRGAYDVGLFLSQSLETSAQKAREMDLLRAYHDTLLESEVWGYDFDQLLHDYRLATLYCLAYPVIVGGTLDLANEREVALVTAMLDRSVAAIVDLDAGELLPK